LIGIGFVIIYRGTFLLNFAQGLLALLGGYFFYSMGVTLGLPFVWAVLCAVSAELILGAVLYVLIMQRLLGEDPLRLVMVTIALATALTAIIQMTYGANELYLQTPFQGSVSLGGVQVSTLGLATIVTATILIVAFTVALRYSTFGLAMRAAAENPQLLTYCRISVRRVSMLTWAMAIGAGGIAGIAYGASTPLTPSSADVAGFAAFPVVILGGIDSVGGALVGAIVLAEAQGFATSYLGGLYSNVAGYVLLFVVLAVRPTGLFGSREVTRL
jgi:branched-chain amino acid transport system permease protein